MPCRKSNMNSKRKCRQYSEEYLQFGFIPSPSNVQLRMCLVCGKSFSNEAMKPSRLLDHLKSKHADKKDKPVSFFQDLKDKYGKRNTITSMMTNCSEQAGRGLLASYKISYLIAKCGKPHTIAENLIIPAVKEIMSTMFANPVDIISNIPLSNNSVSRRINDMADELTGALVAELKSTKFALQIDESTLRDSEALLLGYVRFLSKNDEIREELLFSEFLTADTKASTIFKTVEKVFKDKQIPMSNVIACATDGAPAMIGRHRGFIQHMKTASPGILAIHCIIHRQHLVAKHLSAELHESLQVFIKAVNKIKTSPSNDRLFRKLCQEKDEEFQRLLLHTEVRWLSKGNCLRRLHDLFDTVVKFLQKVDANLSKELSNRRVDLAYLSDVFDKLNELNLKLQGKQVNLIKAKSVVMGFINKLTLFKQNMGRRELCHFPKLQEMLEKNELKDENVRIYCSHLGCMTEEMTTRFKDLSNLVISDWIINPFLADSQQAQQTLQTDLIDLQNDCEAEVLFRKKDFESFWIAQRSTYPRLWEFLKVFILAFPTTYLVEKGFSAVVNLLQKNRNRLQIATKGDLKLFLSDIKPDFVALASRHQAQGSH